MNKLERGFIMSNKSIFKKLGLAIILIIIVVGIIFVIINSSLGKKEEKVNTNSTTISKNSRN